MGYHLFLGNPPLSLIVESVGSASGSSATSAISASVGASTVDCSASAAANVECSYIFSVNAASVGSASCSGYASGILGSVGQSDGSAACLVFSAGIFSTICQSLGGSVCEAAAENAAVVAVSKQISIYASNISKVINASFAGDREVLAVSAPININASIPVV